MIKWNTESYGACPLSPAYFKKCGEFCPLYVRLEENQGCALNILAETLFMIQEILKEDLALWTLKEEKTR